MQPQAEQNKERVVGLGLVSEECWGLCWGLCWDGGSRASEYKARGSGAGVGTVLHGV